MDWEQFLDPYIQAVGELKIKLRGIRKQFRKQNRHSPIEFVTGRSNLSMMWMRFWICFVIVVI